MKTRILTSVLIVAIAVPMFLLSDYIVYPIVLAALSALSVFEMLRVLRFNKKLFISIPSYLIAIALPIGAYFYRYDPKDFFIFCSVIVYLYLLYLLIISVVTRATVKFSSVTRVFCAASYVTLAFSALSIIRYIDNGVYCFVIPFICSWASDVFALVVGRIFGKHPLIPEISPKKTVEGSIGGVVFATAAMLLYGYLLDVFVESLSANYIVLGVMGLVLSMISQAGDLIASTIKREEGVKDYGNILPGHGGITDRFDSVYAVAFIALVICVVFPPFV